MVTTELKPLILNLSDEETEEEGVPNFTLPVDDELSEEDDDLSGNPGHKTKVDDFDLDDELIENPGEEDF